MVGKKKKFKWDEEQQETSDALKEALTHPPLLALPHGASDLILDTDASDYAEGSELLQIQNNEEKVIAYGSFALTAEQRKYCTQEKSFSPYCDSPAGGGITFLNMAEKFSGATRAAGEMDGGALPV